MSNFDAVGIESNKRIQDAKKLLDHITEVERPTEPQELVKILKGSFCATIWCFGKDCVFPCESVHTNP